MLFSLIILLHRILLNTLVFLLNTLNARSRYVLFNVKNGNRPTCYIVPLFIFLITILLSVTGNAYARPAFSCHSNKTSLPQAKQVLEISCNVANAFVGHSDPIGIIGLVSTSSKTVSVNTSVINRIKYRRGIKKEERYYLEQVVERLFRPIEISSKQRIQELTSNLPWNIADTEQLRC